jgi:CRP-like cAMP-binding protein
MSLVNPPVFYSPPLNLIEQNPITDFFERMVQDFGNSCARLIVKRNTIICTQGTKLSCFYLIKKGEVLLNRLSPDGRATVNEPFLS